MYSEKFKQLVKERIRIEDIPETGYKEFNIEGIAFAVCKVDGKLKIFKLTPLKL